MPGSLTIPRHARLSRPAALAAIAVAALAAPAARADNVIADRRDDLGAAAFADDPDGVLSFAIDNDYFGLGAADRWYTSGFEASYLFPSDATPFLSSGGADWLLGPGPRRLELRIGQNLFTPEEKGPSTPIADDRPYGAFLFLGADIVSLKPNRSFAGAHALAEDRIGLRLGAVGGDAALGEATQELVHSITDGADAEGWDNGLENEPGFLLIAQRDYHIYGDGPAGLELALRPHADFAIGTIEVQAGVGFELRIGDDLEYDFSRRENRAGIDGGGFFTAPDDYAWSTFIGVNSRAVAHSVYLDGNVLRDGPNDAIDIERSLFVHDATFGFSFTRKWFRTSASYTLRTKEFEEQDEAQGFGSITFSYRF